MQPAHKRNKRRMPPLHQWLCALALVGGVALTVGLGYKLSHPPAQPQENVAGDTGSQPESQAAPEEQVPSDGFTFEINQTLTGRSGQQGVEVDLHFANPADNPVSLRVQLVLEMDGTVVFSSQPVPAGDKLETALLQQAVQPGQYECTAYITALESQTLEELGDAQQKVQLTVE